MKSRLFRIPAAIVFSVLLVCTMLPASSTLAQTRATASDSPYGGDVVEEIIARVNDQIITRSDYERARAEMDDAAREHGATQQEISEGHKDLLRGLIDQQLWLSKGKELGITGDTELVKQLDEYRKKYNLETIEDLEKAAKEQGVSWEDFQANIRNGIITQEVMRQEIGSKVQFTPGEAVRYYEQHKQEYAQPESVHLSEILVSTGTPAPTISGETPADDPAKLAAAKAKADDIEAKLHAGGDFGQLAKSFSDGPTAAEGGDLGQYKRGQLAKVLEDQTFALKAGQYTEPIRTRQGYVIFKVAEHVPGGPAPYKDVENQVDEALYMSRMEPAIRAYLTQMREEAYIDCCKMGLVDTGASPKETKPVYTVYTPPAPKKKAKVERTRYRETTHTFRQKGPASALTEPAPAPAPAAAQAKPKKSFFGKKKSTDTATEKPGKKEKIRYGQKPLETLPAAPGAPVENAGALPETASNAAEPANPLLPAAPTAKSRFSSRAKQTKHSKQTKGTGAQPDALAPAPPEAAEIADRQTQSAPLGLGVDTSAKTKKTATTTGDKTRIAKTKKQKKPKAQPEMTPTPAVPGAPAPASSSTQQNQTPPPATQTPAPPAQP